MAKKRRKPQPGPAAKRHPVVDAPAGDPPPDRTAETAVDETNPLVRYRVAIVVGLAAIGIAGALLVSLSMGARDDYACRSTDVPVGTTTAASDRGALDRLLETTPSLPKEGWGASEPNRFTRSATGMTMVVNVVQTDDGSWQASRYDVCGVGV